MAHPNTEISLEWFGTTTFRLRTLGLTIFLDTWLERPSVLEQYLSIADVTEADYIFISHAHFDHLPGADRLAIKTGAIVVANCEAINLLRKAGVPDEQLIPVAGGERIPLFSRLIREKAQKNECRLGPGPPAAPPIPHPSLAVAAAHIWPSLHCLMPADHANMPDIIDTATEYIGAAHPYVCTFDQTRGMKHGLLKIGERVPRNQMDDGLRSFVDYISDQDRNVFSHCDGGQIMVNLVLNGKSLLWNAHLGAYEGIMKTLEPKPDIAILGIAGRGNLNGKPYDGCSAEFALNEVLWLNEPETVIWCLQDQCAIKPYSINTAAATKLVEEKSRSRVTDLQHAKSFTSSL